MVDTEAGALRYKAFLSYSHRDAAAAARLHRRLESYRLPRRLAGSAGARGPVPERLWPIFRDREELPAATDLSETVRAALAESASLIVLCSPNAAASLWVAEEIETFRRLYPERPILAAIVDGEPGGCFPAALRAFGRDGIWHEPLATDLRAEGDGPQLGLLKLVAGITGVGLDALVQRDAQRRVRRVTAVTAAALLALLMMTALTVVALNARSEAERQRAEAEGLIEFMLTDLRTRLKGVGRIDVMQAVNARALQHYEQAQLADLPGESLLRRARILRIMGEDHMTRGDFDAALLAFREAHRTTAEQMARTPNDARRLLEHARSEYRIGRVHEARGEWLHAQRQYVRAAVVTDRLIRAAPHHRDYMMIAASTATNLGNVQLNHVRDFAAAQRSYETAILWYGRVAVANPHDREAQRELANAYANLADTFFARQQWHQSLDARRRQYRILERLHRREPANMEDNFRLTVAQRGVAASLIKAGNRQEAHSHLSQAYARASRLTRHDPRNADWLLVRAMIGCELLYREPDRLEARHRANLLYEVRAIATALDRQHNPRVSLISNCRTAAEQEGADSAGG